MGSRRHDEPERSVPERGGQDHEGRDGARACERHGKRGEQDVEVDRRLPDEESEDRARLQRADEQVPEGCLQARQP